MEAARSEGAASWIGWRSVAEQQVRDGDLDAAMEAYKEADRRAPPDERPAIASRLAWLAKETGHDFVARREFNRSRGAYATYTPLVTWILIGANVGVFAIDAVPGRDGRPGPDVRRRATPRGGDTSVPMRWPPASGGGS